MKKLKIIFLSIAVLVALPFIITSFTTREYFVEVSIVIKKNKSEVFNYIKNLKNKDDYSVRSRLDKKMKIKNKGRDGKVGFISEWISEKRNVGIGEEIILKIENGKSIHYQIKQLAPYHSITDALLEVKKMTDSTTSLVCQHQVYLKYPNNILLLTFDFKNNIEDNLQKELVNIKNILEKK